MQIFALQHKKTWSMKAFSLLVKDRIKQFSFMTFHIKGKR
jgi:hypothetical protein